MKQYECRNVAAVRAKLYELTRTRPIARAPDEKKEERDYWREFCHSVKRDAEKGVSDWSGVSDIPAFDENENATEVRVCVGYDVSAKIYLVWIE